VKDPLSGAPLGAETVNVEEVVGDSKSREESEPTKFSEVPLVYSPKPPIPHPHIVLQGKPPKLTPKPLAKWQPKMKSYLCCSSIELWTILEEVYMANNPEDLTRRKVVDFQLNATPLYMLRQAVGEGDRPYIENDTTAKAAWNTLMKVFLGNSSMRRNKYEQVINKAERFLMEEGEDHQDMYHRVSRIFLSPLGTSVLLTLMMSGSRGSMSRPSCLLMSAFLECFYTVI
jgi:hypothetical protein